MPARGVCGSARIFRSGGYICAVAKVLLNMNQPVYALAYGLGFATGTYLGMTIEQRLAFGKQLVFSSYPERTGPGEVLRAGDYRVAELKRTNPRWRSDDTLRGNCAARGKEAESASPMP
jgi:uncharacterized protein YebE (UPF0316 family)